MVEHLAVNELEKYICADDVDTLGNVWDIAWPQEKVWPNRTHLLSLLESSCVCLTLDTMVHEFN